MNMLELINEAINKMNDKEPKIHYVICTGNGLIANGLCIFNGESIVPEKNYIVELANYPFNVNPTAIKEI